MTFLILLKGMPTKMIKLLGKLVKQPLMKHHSMTFLLAFHQGFEGLLKRRPGSLDHLRSSWSWFRRSTHIGGRPINITIEPATSCNLKCPVCETGAGILGRPKAFMSIAQFKIIIDKIASHTNTLMLYFMGETFLNKDAYEMISYAKRQGIPFVTACTNGDVVNPEKLVDSGIDELSFQIGGITQETHQKYRIGSRLDRVLDNLRQTIALRDQKELGLRIVCGFILMKHNEHETDQFKSLMSQFGVDEALIIDPCVRTWEQGTELLPEDETHWVYDPAAFQQGLLKPRKVPNNECPWIYYSLAIQVNGDVVPCCRDATGKFVMGNILTQDLAEIWNGPKFRNFRKKLLSNQKHLRICRLCSGYGVSPLK